MTIPSSVSNDFTKTYSHLLSKEERKAQECTWKMEQTHLFDELLFSWNGKRPEHGKWTFWASIFTKEWSPWIRYAEWGSNHQRTFKYAAQGSLVESYQDAIYPKDGLCTAFQTKVTAEDGANLEQLEELFVCVSTLANHHVTLPKAPLETVFLSNVPRCSQLKLNHPRFLDLCSPTATSTAINYLLGTKKTDPISFSDKIHDGEFDIYGNWILNTAQAFQELEGKFSCHVERLPSFVVLHSYLMKGLPVIVSVRSPLVGSYRPMVFGHLLCIIGYDAKEQKVHCVDSGFPEDDQTHVSYPLQDFLNAWARRQNISYLFTPKHS